MAFKPFKRSIASYAAEPENNYLLLRLFAALLVIYGHSYAITRLRRQEDLLQSLLGFTFAGGVGVDIFFVVSGFLVTASYLNRRSWTDFMKARCLRIFPGLLVCLLAVGFILGPLVSTLSLGAYLSSPDPYLFLFKNITLIKLHFTLPGVFEHLPLQSVNGSLWTLPAEFLLYLTLSEFGAIGLLFQRRWYLLVVVILCGLLAALCTQVPFFEAKAHYLRLFMMFAAGSLVRSYYDRIPLSTWLLAAATVPMVLLHRNHFFPYVFSVWLVYAVFWFAYVPPLHVFNRMGDYSYGLYIYAFPIQQTLRQCFPAILPLQLFAAASVLTLGCAMLSWHLVEQPALRLKKARFRELLHRHVTVI